MYIYQEELKNWHRDSKHALIQYKRRWLARKGLNSMNNIQLISLLMMIGTPLVATSFT